MFPEELCRALSKLQADAPTHSYSYTKTQIEKELGVPILSFFDSFETNPIASGSIAQIYKAILNNRIVAVKVRHPNVEQQIKIDFDLMNLLALFIESLPGLSWINLSESMAQFSKTIASQVNLDIEGKNLRQFNKNFYYWKDTSFPEPIVLTNSVLIETYLHGDNTLKITNIIKNQRSDYLDLAHFIVSKGTDIYLKMLLNDNLMHADLHPGNILIHFSTKTNSILSTSDSSVANTNQPLINNKNNAIKKKEVDVEFRLKQNDNVNNALHFSSNKKIDYKIALVDAGMVAELTDEEKINFIGLLEAVGDGDANQASDCLIQFSKNKYSQYYLDKKHDDIIEKEIDLFKNDVKILFKKVCNGYGTNVVIGEILRELLKLLRIYRITIDSNYATLVMNVLCLDGLAHSVLPEYNLLDGAKPWLKWNKRIKKFPKFLSKKMLKWFSPLIKYQKYLNDKKILLNLKKKKNKLLK
jgi:aarF domain-containing kinase